MDGNYMQLTLFDAMQDDLSVSIVILYDGFALFPEKKAAMDIPVLWCITDERVTPPWGKIARIKCDDRSGK